MIERLGTAMGRGPLVLDAAMGTRLIALGLRLGEDDPALWAVDRPAAVLDLHRRDVAAGSDALLTNTFGANRVWLARLGRAGDLEAINRGAVALARQAAGAGRLVLASIGPTAAADPDSCREQASILVDAGADALCFETHRLDQAEAALRSIGRAPAVPLLVSLVAWPADLGEAVRRLAGLGASAVGANCQSGMEPALRLARALRGLTELPLIVKPGAGLLGEPQASPGSFASAASSLRDLGPILVGGCCGTTEAHVAALHAAWYDVRECTRAEDGGDPAEFEPS